MNRDLFQQAVSAMRHDMRRTLLTMAGMAWGIATVVLLLAYGNGFGRAIQNIFEASMQCWDQRHEIGCFLA
jgi:putative ABC transport system permease protein